MIGAPENGFMVEDGGVAMTYESTGKYFPGMAQAIMASEIKKALFATAST